MKHLMVNLSSLRKLMIKINNKIKQNLPSHLLKYPKNNYKSKIKKWKNQN